MLLQHIEEGAIDVVMLVYAAAGLANLIGGPLVRRIFNQWHYHGQFHRVIGALEILSVVFLVFPGTRILGLVMAGIIGFFSVVTLLNHRQYGWSVPAMLLFAAIVPAAFAQS
ncbi:MAG TPA: DoxX family protein [Rhizomicrobium sp.]|nr:DoxX family protein [Rhizomicrobium sp.]